MSRQPVYVSEPTVKSLGQKYEIYDDRLELHTLIKNVVIPFDHIERVEVVPPVIQRLWIRFRNMRMGIKLDFSDLNEHIVLEKDSGFRYMAFTPRKPAEFKAALDRALARFRDAHSSAPQ